MILEDVIMLARTVPEPSKRYGVKVCSVVYSPELKGLIRIYPLLPNERIRSRHTLRVELERNRMDSRRESFKKINYSLTGNVVQKEGLESIFDSLVSEDISELNDQRKSLGIIKTNLNDCRFEMKSKKDVEDPRQLCLFQSPDLNTQKLMTGQDYKHIPYVVVPGQKQQKNLQIREWGIYELIRKNDGVISDKYLTGIFKGEDVYFIVGNMNGCRSVWIVCSFYTFPGVRQQNMFSMAA
jgi:hypothetical protein